MQTVIDRIGSIEPPQGDQSARPRRDLEDDAQNAAVSLHELLSVGRSDLGHSFISSHARLLFDRIFSSLRALHQKRHEVSTAEELSLVVL